MTFRNGSRAVLSLAPIAASAALLVGCSGATPETGGAQTVTWWGWNVFNSDQVIADFEKANPDITIDYEQYSYNDCC